MHSFLFEPAIWRAEGSYWDDRGQSFATEGRVTISHEPELWINTGSMRILSQEPVEFTNRYEIEPPAPKAMTLRWTSLNPTIGRLSGTITIAGESIISLYQSEQDNYLGTEHMSMVNAGEYHGNGVFFEGDRRLSAWHMRLYRE